jgi:hypothetical protein
MSLQTAQSLIRITGESGTQVDGLNLTLNNSLVLGFNCAPLAIGKSNTMMGYNAALNTRLGSRNTVYGFEAAQNMGGDGNIYIGTRCVALATVAAANTVVGTDGAPTIVTGSSNVVVGMRADVRAADDTGVLAVGFSARAGQGNDATAVGSHSLASGRQALAVGHGARASGPGAFNFANRLRGGFANGGALATDTYAVQLSADVLKLTGALAFCEPGSNAVTRWAMYLDPVRAAGVSPGETRRFADLVVRSANQAAVRFRDEFHPGVFDFTAQHRCVYEPPPGGSDAAGLPGCVVVATGRYCGLDGLPGVAAMDEAIPVVTLSRRPRDGRAFGVIHAVEDEGGTRDFALGNLVFQVAKTEPRERRVIVNAAGEGAIWVTDANGALKNGDLLTTSHVPGLAMRQGSDLCRSHTVAKITCDCDFRSNAPSPVLPVGLPGLRKVLVGCVYKF